MRIIKALARGKVIFELSISLNILSKIKQLKTWTRLAFVFWVIISLSPVDQKIFIYGTFDTCDNVRALD